jgi:hypothetical protein
VPQYVADPDDVLPRDIRLSVSHRLGKLLGGFRDNLNDALDCSHHKEAAHDLGNCLAGRRRCYAVVRVGPEAISPTASEYPDCTLLDERKVAWNYAVSGAVANLLAGKPLLQRFDGSKELGAADAVPWQKSTSTSISLSDVASSRA